MLASLPILDKIRAAFPANVEAYLVGGAVRDLILQRPTHDLDFVVAQDALGTARRVADRLGGAYYPLTEDPPTGRVVLIRDTDEDRLVLDFAQYRGPDLESDLRGRDFTINAIAMSLSGLGKVIDPLGGGRDLRDQILRACDPTAIQADPLRAVRAVRMAITFDLRILPETRDLIRASVSNLAAVSPERVRDEFFRILENPRAAGAVQILDTLGILEIIFPELVALKGVPQSPPHIGDVWSHTMRTLTKLDGLLQTLGPIHDPDEAGDLMMGLAAGKIGRYRQQLDLHLAEEPTTDRTVRQLLSLAALVHDVGKPETKTVNPDGRIQFLKHQQVGEEMAGEIAARLKLSNHEARRLRTIVHHHMRPLLLAQSGEPPSRRATYRFFRDTGPVGVDIVLLSLADTLATYGPTLPQGVWSDHLNVSRTLLEAWWKKKEEQVLPPPLVRGEDLMQRLGMAQGPKIGEVLERVREAQAVGEITTRAEALEFARKVLDEN
jgi:putative nucleotidyltransferase with HDIG domain